MIGRFHDKDFDGVVLKIPKWFIEMNKVDVDAIKNILGTATMSIYHPDHMNNIYELDMYEAKTEHVKAIEERTDMAQKKAKARYESILNGEIKELEFKKFDIQADSDDISFKGEHFSWEDYTTNKMNIKSEFKNWFKSTVATFEDFKDFIGENFMFAKHLLINTNESIVDWRGATFCIYSKYPVLQINIDILMVRIDVTRAKNNSYRYGRTPLKFDGSHYCIGGPNNSLVPYVGYKMERMSLVRD